MVEVVAKTPRRNAEIRDLSTRSPVRQGPRGHPQMVGEFLSRERLLLNCKKVRVCNHYFPFPEPFHSSLMSVIPFSLLLRQEIMALDAQVERECEPRGTMGLDALCWPAESARRLTAYYTGTVKRRELPKGYTQRAYTLEMMMRDFVRFCTPNKSALGKCRGRPLKVSIEAPTHLNCSRGHARRLASSGKARQRHREKPDADTQRMLALHKRRAELVREMKDQEVREALALEVEQLICAWIPLGELHRRAELQRRAQFRRLVAAAMGNLTPQAAAVVYAFAQGNGLRHAAHTLQTSAATLSRMLSASLPELRRCGESLREFAQSGMAIPEIAPMPIVRRLVIDEGNAWDAQTTFLEPIRPRRISHG